MKIVYKYLNWILALVLIGSLNLASYINAWNNDLLEIYILDVGQGDAILIKTPSNKLILIDSGPDGSVLDRVASKIPRWVKKIDVLVLSHPHADHIGGFKEIMNKYSFDYLLISRVKYESKVYSDFINKISEKSAVVIPARAGRVLNIGDGVSLNVLYPFTDREGIGSSNLNNESVVLTLEYDMFKMFLGGDIESGVERKISLYMGDEIQSNALKISHHGSNTSTDPLFLDLVNPLVSFISVGEGNKYDHPDPVVIRRLEKKSIKYYRTDVNGTLSIITDGEIVSINKYAK